MISGPVCVQLCWIRHLYPCTEVYFVAATRNPVKLHTNISYDGPHCRKGVTLTLRIAAILNLGESHFCTFSKAIVVIPMKCWRDIARVRSILSWNIPSNYLNLEGNRSFKSKKLHFLHFCLLQVASFVRITTKFGGFIARGRDTLCRKMTSNELIGQYIIGHNRENNRLICTKLKQQALDMRICISVGFFSKSIGVYLIPYRKGKKFVYR